MGVSGSSFVGNITQSASTSDPSTIIHVERNGTNGVKIATQGKYGQVAYGGYPASLGDDPETYFTLEAISPGNGAIHTKPTGDYAESSYYSVYNGNITSWEASGDTEYWVFEPAEEITVSLNDAGDGNYYATFCAPFGYTVGDGTKAYTLEQSGEWLVPTEVDGTVAAGTPVLLKGTSSTATLTIGTDWAATPVGGTALTGTYLAKTIDGATDYVLGIGDSGVVGFYHWNSNNLGANRAYYDTPSAVKGFVIMFDDDATGINSIENGQLTIDNEIYNLAGQRISKMQKGINIVNGKKILK